MITTLTPMKFHNSRQQHHEFSHAYFSLCRASSSSPHSYMVIHTLLHTLFIEIIYIYIYMHMYIIYIYTYNSRLFQTVSKCVRHKLFMLNIHIAATKFLSLGILYFNFDICFLFIYLLFIFCFLIFFFFTIVNVCRRQVYEEALDRRLFEKQYVL